MNRCLNRAPGSWRSWLIGLIVLLAGCGGGGDGGGGASCSPSPRINSSASTQATVGQQYRYHVDARYACIPFFTDCGGIDAVQLPPGAGIDDLRDAVFWTPSAGSENATVPFTIATKPDLCGDRVTQSWSVTVRAAPVIESFTASRSSVNPGESVSLTAVFRGGTGTIDGVNSIVTSGVPITTAAISADTSFTLRVNNGRDCRSPDSLLST